MQLKRLLTSIFLFAVVAFNLGAGTLFTHSHRLGSEVIVHSHPFTGAASSHSHSTSSFETISRMVFGDAMESSEATLSAPLGTTLAAYSQHAVGEYVAQCTTLHLLRAPPYHLA